MRSRIFLALVSLVFLAGCGEKLEPGTPITWERVSKGEMREQRVSLEGYFQIPTSVLASDTMLLPMTEKPGGEGGKVPFSTRIGSGNNQVESLPDDFKETDIKVHANDGSLLSKDQKIRVTGKLVGNGDSTILFGPVMIEKL